MLKADAVFEGGGVKGIGLVGAVCRIEEAGYKWERVAGTSAGAMIASLIAVGYTGNEIKKIMYEFNYKDFLDDKGLQTVPVIGKSLSLLIQKGVYSGDKIEEWFRDKLRQKGAERFKDVSQNGNSRLKIIAADITRKEMLILPDDIEKYGINPGEFDIARAVRMSISMPFFFIPIKLKNINGVSFIVDGGVLSNYPIWIFDSKMKPKWPTFGFKLVEPKISRTGLGKTDIVSFSLDIISTMLDKNEERYIKNSDFIRTICIPSVGINTTEFNISTENRTKLFNSGYDAADKFIENWDFERYIRAYRS